MENEKIQEPPKYRVLARTFRKIGEDVLAIGGLIVSLSTPLVPKDSQKKIAERTGMSARTQTLFSGMSEMLEAAVLIAPYSPPVAIYAFFEGGARFTFALTGPLEDVLSGKYSEREDKWAIGSLPIEGVYKAGKGLRNWFLNNYNEAYLEVKRETV